ncbi:hypothetical protein C8J55DRAFT_486542 [Lentinula edodes]|uniref:Uncharacterized protein n=1 Tax=Lentinula lateritia TaxID=40482 RepID=A0A9W9AW12_9AGAR|nr:hypothetical protein C8J55DRAFT_486542 [Lentinula edodes]
MESAIVVGYIGSQNKIFVSPQVEARSRVDTMTLVHRNYGQIPLLDKSWSGAFYQPSPYLRDQELDAYNMHIMKKREEKDIPVSDGFEKIYSIFRIPEALPGFTRLYQAFTNLSLRRYASLGSTNSNYSNRRPLDSQCRAYIYCKTENKEVYQPVNHRMSESSLFPF